MGAGRWRGESAQIKDEQGLERQHGLPMAGKSTAVSRSKCVSCLLIR